MANVPSLASISDLLGAQLSVPEFMRSLIDQHAAKYPQHDWRPIHAIEWNENGRLSQWLDRLLIEEPPSRPRVLWLGLFNPIINDQPTADLYIAGSKTWKADGDWWGVGRKTWWWPNSRYSNSRCLHELYQRCYPTGPGNDGENLLGLGYAARVLVELVQPPHRERLLGGSAKVALAVGWDSGSPFELGMLNTGGLQLRTAAETGALEARAAEASAKWLAEFEASQEQATRARNDKLASATRTFSPPDGRRWSIAALDGTVHLEFTDPDGDVFRRQLHGAEGTPEAATALITEQLADGFLEEFPS
jgi:hypothetical protein